MSPLPRPGERVITVLRSGRIDSDRAIFGCLGGRLRLTAIGALIVQLDEISIRMVVRVENSEVLPVPLLLHYARPAPVASVPYRYDSELGVNVVTDVGGGTRPAVEGPDAPILTKSQTVVDGED